MPDPQDLVTISQSRCSASDLTRMEAILASKLATSKQVSISPLPTYYPRQEAEKNPPSHLPFLNYYFLSAKYSFGIRITAAPYIVPNVVVTSPNVVSLGQNVVSLRQNVVSRRQNVSWRQMSSHFAKFRLTSPNVFSFRQMSSHFAKCRLTSPISLRQMSSNRQMSNFAKCRRYYESL